MAMCSWIQLGEIMPKWRIAYLNHSMEKHNHFKCGMKLIIHSQISTVQPLKFMDWCVSKSHTSLGMWLIIIQITSSINGGTNHISPIT